MKKLPIEELFIAQDKLDKLLVAGDITFEQYEMVWKSLLDNYGYSEAEYSKFVDERWNTFVDRPTQKLSKPS